MTRDEARRQAQLKFGNPQKVRESLWMQNTPQRLTAYRPRREIRLSYAEANARILDHRDWVMAFCIGAATSLFTVVRSVLLRPLPFRDPARLVMVYEHLRGAHRIKLPSLLRQRTSTTGARRPTALKTWPSWVMPGTV